MVNTITAKAAKESKDKGERVIFVDVRTPGEYRSRHIKGSYNIPLDDIGKVARDFSDLNGKVIFLCKSGARSTRACVNVSMISHSENLFSLDGGFEELEKVGFEIVEGRGLWDIERQVRLVAGSLIVLGVGSGYFVSNLFFLLSGFVGVGLMFAAITNTCTMGMILMKMPYNKGGKNIHVKTTMHDIVHNL